MNSTSAELEKSASRSFNFAFERATNILASIGTLWIMVLMLLIVADVIGRNFLNQPITGVAEIAGRSVVAIVFLQLPAAVGANKLTRSDFLIGRIGRHHPKIRLFLEVLFTFTSSIVFLALTWASWPEFISSWETAEFFGVQGIFTIPTWPFRGLMLLGPFVASLASLVFLCCLI